MSRTMWRWFLASASACIVGAIGLAVLLTAAPPSPMGRSATSRPPAQQTATPPVQAAIATLSIDDERNLDGQTSNLIRVHRADNRFQGSVTNGGSGGIFLEPYTTTKPLTLSDADVHAFVVALTAAADGTTPEQSALKSYGETITITLDGAAGFGTFSCRTDEQNNLIWTIDYTGHHRVGSIPALNTAVSDFQVLTTR